MVDMKEIKDSLPDEDDANDPDVSFQTHHLAFFIAAIGRRKVPTKIQPPRTYPDRPTVPPKHSQFAHTLKDSNRRLSATLTSFVESVHMVDQRLTNELSAPIQ